MSVAGVTDREWHSHYRTVRLAGREPMEVKFGHSHKGKMFRPDTASAKWDHNTKITNIELAGVVLRKDGSPGANRVKLHYTTPASEFHGKYNEDSMAPEWLLELFADAPAQGDK